MNYNSDMVLDKLRENLTITKPETIELPWLIAKVEMHQLMRSIKPTSYKTKLGLVVFGAVAGIVARERIPKSYPVQVVKFVKEIFMAQKRLNKIVVEEYERIDEAIEAEQNFLNMMYPSKYMVATFTVNDENGQRSIQSHLNMRNTKKDKNS